MQSLVDVPQTTSEEKLSSDEYWDLIEETVSSPEKTLASIKHLNTWFNNEIPSEGFAYVYGGKTANKIQKGTSKNYSGILACYFDNEEYSGIGIVLGGKKSVNVESLRKDHPCGLGFWAKGNTFDQSIYVGLVDDESDGMKVQTKLALRDFGKVDTTWNYYMIPLKKFPSKGKYWDDTKKMEVMRDVDWKAISEVRFSANKLENKVNGKEPVKFYAEHVSIIDDIPGYFDPDKYWEKFTSNEPDILLHDLESHSDQQWETGKGPASQIKIEVVKSTEKKFGEKSLSITYQLSDWCDAMFNYEKNGTSSKNTDWTKHWGIKFNLYSNRPFQQLNIQINDAGNELYIAPCGGPQGWSEVLVPFKDFYKFPYYQPADAVHNGRFDLEKIRVLDVKPAGEGTNGTFIVDNIRLTNNRLAEVVSVATEKDVAITGSYGTTIVKKVSDGIFGINAQFWDSDLLNPTTAEFVKNVNHAIIRFPGGLSSDEYHWQEGLAKKDAEVNIDEFMDFCTKTKCEPMITVNFGTGTPEEAAAWVKYLNIDKKKNVKLWEVGNELYGTWHKKHCSAEEYGKRAVDFIKAMKNVDPSILITVVWDLEGDWNKEVFKYTKDIADGVNVHNYPQGSGEENDIALLASPQILDDIIKSVRSQLSDFGQKGKAYQIWLTEWNSVDFNPGPQSLGIVNGLFVADYLGMLAKQNIEQASYWNIHNGFFENGGDYGYLSRSDLAEGVNIPRPSYWGFKLANESLRGSLVQCSSDDKKVSAYANLHSNGTKSLLIINKYPQTSANVTLTIPGLAGNGVISQLVKESPVKGYSTTPIVVKDGMPLRLPPYSITVIQVK